MSAASPENAARRRWASSLVGVTIPDRWVRVASAAGLGAARKTASGDAGSKGALEFLLRRMRHKSDFPAMSDAVVRIQRVAASDKESLNSLADEILRDVALTNKLLRLVNSPYYGLRSKVSSVDRALMTLGQYGIRQWVAVIAVSELSGNAPAELIVTSAIRARFCQAVGHAVGMGEQKAAE